MEIQGLDEFAKTLNNAQDNYKKETKKLLNEIGMKLKTRVVLKTPVDTGVLRRSWKYKTINENEGILSNGVHYAQYVEYGHRTRGGKSFIDGVYMLEKSVKEIESELDKEFSIMIDNLFK
jgi:hypothetical protein